MACDGAGGQVFFAEGDEVIEDVFAEDIFGFVDAVFCEVVYVAGEIGGVGGQGFFCEAGFEDACAEKRIELEP